MISSIEFLPQSQISVMVDNKTRLTILNLKLLLLSELENALRFFFIEKDLSKFDPHVGETSCQIRACQILSLIEKLDKGKFNINFNQRLNDISSAKKKIFDTISMIQAFKPNFHFKTKSFNPKQKLHEFLNENECFLMLQQEEFFLFHAYILTNYRKVNGFGDMCINYKKIYEDLKLSRALTAKFIHIYQVRLSEWSCDFVQQRLLLLKDKALAKITPLLRKKDNDGRSILPCFHMSEILLRDLLRMKKNIVVVVERRSKIAHLDKVVIPFEVIRDKYQYYKTIQNKPCFIVYGTMVYQDNAIVETHEAYIHRFINIGVVNALLANMATHPQYSGLIESPYDLVTDAQEMDIIKNLNNTYLNYLDLGIKIGCEKSNPELLFIRHINCNRPDFSHIS